MKIPTRNDPAAWKIARTVAYLVFTAGGVAVLVWPPVSYAPTAAGLTALWGVLLVGSGLAAAFGVAFARYAWEWSAAYFLAAGLAVYAFLSWGTVAAAPGNIPRALIITSSALMFVARAMQMGIDDKRARLAVTTRREVHGG